MKMNSNQSKNPLNNTTDQIKRSSSAGYDDGQQMTPNKNTKEHCRSKKLINSKKEIVQTAKTRNKEFNLKYKDNLSLSNQTNDYNEKSEKFSTSSSPNSPSSTLITRTIDYRALSQNFKKRKSHSQMDFQRIRSFSTHAVKSPSIGDLSINRMSSSNNDMLKHTFRIGEDFYHFVNDCDGSEVDVKIAGMKIFASVMLNAWRRRRDDVKHLQEELNRTKKVNIKTKNQIHVLNSLFKIEQKQNNDLNNRLRKTNSDLKNLQNMYDELNISHLELNTQKSIIEENLSEKLKINENLNILLEDTRSDLFRVMSRERELAELYSNEQRKCLQLENDKNDLLSELSNLKSDHNVEVSTLQDQISIKEKSIEYYKNQLDRLEKKLYELKNMETQVREFQILDITQRQTIHDLNMKINTLENELDNSFENRIKSLIRMIPSKTFSSFYLIAFYLLPAVPPKSNNHLINIPFGIDKKISNLLFSKTILK